jgi:hypothetical protein
MTVSSARLAEELQGLCRGRGVHAPGIDRLVGEALREVCGIDPADGPDTVRAKLSGWVTGVVEEFPAELRMDVLVPLALHDQAQHRFLADRIAWLAAEQDRGVRTIRRRIKAGLDRVVETAVSRPAPRPAADEEWHVAEFDALLRLDGPTVVCTERRTVVADRAGLDELTWSITIPAATPNGPPGGLDVEVLQGVELVGSEQPSARRFLMRLRLPRPLDVGQRHQFALQVRLPLGQPMRPTYVFWPERHCERFHLVVRFPRHRPPETVWRVDGAFHRDTDDLLPTDDRLTPNAIGEIDVEFDRPRRGRGYGVQWRVPEAAVEL